VVIEAWKITKAVDIKLVSRDQGNIKFLPWIQVTDKHVLTDDEKKTQEFVLVYYSLEPLNSPC
jgi:hypothetical protein